MAITNKVELSRMLADSTLAQDSYSLDGLKVENGLSLSNSDGTWTVTRYENGLKIEQHWLGSEYLACAHFMMNVQHRAGQLHASAHSIFKDRSELKRALEQAGVPKRSYNLYGEPADETLTLSKDDDGRWTVHFQERGRRSWQLWFSDESTAFSYLWRSLAEPRR